VRNSAPLSLHSLYTASIVGYPDVEEAAHPIRPGRLQDDGWLVIGRPAAEVDDDPGVGELDVGRLTPADGLAAQHLGVEAA
jgi:hypothetical protein